MNQSLYNQDKDILLNYISCQAPHGDSQTLLPGLVPPHPHLLHQHQHHQVHGVHHTGDGDCDDIVTEQSFLYQTVTADYPEGVFVRGAKRLNAPKKDPDDFVEETEVDQNQTLRTVTWVWVIVRPTTLRTSMVYSKVSGKGTIS